MSDGRTANPPLDFWSVHRGFFVPATGVFGGAGRYWWNGLVVRCHIAPLYPAAAVQLTCHGSSVTCWAL
jgi:hypothetical protein